MLVSLAAAAQEAVRPAQPPAEAPAATQSPITPETPTVHGAPGTMPTDTPGPAPQLPTSVPAARPADIAKAVDCATLAQQFGDTLTALTAPTAAKPLDEGVKNSASDQAASGRKSCMAHDYDAGLDQLRQAIAQLGKQPIL
jgi:hypothetical protein